MFFWESDFVPGRPGTEVFVPGHLLLPLSRDKGTPGQENQKGVSHALILLGMVLLSLLAVMTMENQTSPPTSARPVHRRVCEHANAQKESILWAVS